MSQLNFSFVVSKAVLKDIREVVKVHRRAFPGFLMTLLGPAFLSMYYRAVLDCQESIFLVVRDENNELQGFVAGFAKPEIFYRLLSERKKWMMLSAATHLILRPHLWARVFENMKMVAHRSSTNGSENAGAELASIGVNPSSERRGYGKILVRSFIERAKTKEVDFVFLTTDARDNSSVNEFYLNLGFSLTGCFERAGNRLMNHYEYRIK